MPNPSPERLAALHRAKLAALVDAHFDAPRARHVETPGQTLMVSDSTAFVLVEPADHTALGKGLALADSADASALQLLVATQPLADAGPIAARRAQGLTAPIGVWTVSADRTVGVLATQPALAAVPDPPDLPLELLAELRAAGLDVATEHGVVRGEVLGLEVARIRTPPEGAATIDIGVGVYDQEAFGVIHADAPRDQSLARVRDEVLAKRRVGADSHPFNRLVRERWLRSLAVTQPATLGLSDLHPVPPVLERGGLNDVRPCAAVGADADGRVLVVFSAGIDLDLIPTAAELAAFHQPDRILLAVAERDRHPVNRRLAAKLAWPSSFADVADL